MTNTLITIMLALLLDPTGPRDVDPPPDEPEPGVFLCCEQLSDNAWAWPCDYVPPSECDDLLVWCPYGAKPSGTGYTCDSTSAEF